MYSSLHNHSMFSLLDGYGFPKEYLDRATEIGLKAFAITEHGNEYSWIYFDELKKNYPDLKMIYGIEFYECFDRGVQDKDNKYFHLIALAKNENGRQALNKLITLSNFEGFYSKPRVTIQDIAPYAKDLIISSACLASKLSRESDFNKCIEYVNEYKGIFPSFYLEMQSHSTEDQRKYNNKILLLSEKTNTPFIITTDSHTAEKKDLFYQGKLVQIAHNVETSAEIYEGCYLQTEDEIHSIMDEQIGAENVSIGLNNTNIISDMIDVVDMPFQEPQLPTYPLPDGFNSNYEYMEHLIEQGWKDRHFDKMPLTAENSIFTQENYKKRLKYEINVIHKMGFDGYFLFVRDFIDAAKEKGIEVGKGRGSAAGSLVCYCMQITDIDPIKYGLIFERFLNPERVGLPDIDTDVGSRDEIIDYLVEKYGEQHVCQIINFSFITPGVAITDVGKILGFQYNEMQKLSQKFSYSTFQECLDNNKSLLDNLKYEELFDIAGHLAGRVKTVSIHAGGVGIVDKDMSEYMAMKVGPKGEHVIQVDKHYIEDIGIIKFDILGLANLNLIKEIKNDLNLKPWDIDINNPDFVNDTLPYTEIFDKGLTNGVFQVESAGMKDLILRLQPKNLETISDILALYRPDSMEALDDYVNRTINHITPTYIHSDMKPILENTLGCMIYQEQLLNIVRVFGGRSYGGADLFRKAIGKKNIELVKKESAKLKDEIIKNGYSEKLALNISNNLAQKGGYCFNKSHSYSYAVLCYETAWLKIHYPLYFFKALFNQNKDKAGMINKYILDSHQFNIEVLPPNINKSQINFSINDNKILFGLSAISGIGNTLAELIVNERDKNGEFHSFKNLVDRVSLTKTQIISLIKAGAIPTTDKKQTLIGYLKSLFPYTSYTPLKTVPSPYSKLLEYGLNIEDYRDNTTKRKSVDKERLLKDINSYRYTIFKETQKQKYLKYIEECTLKYLKNEDFWEFETLQIFLKYNPFKNAYKYLTPFEQIEDNNECALVGVISKVQKKKDKNNKQYAFINIYSSFGLIEGIVWHTTFKIHEDLIKKGEQIAVLAKKDNGERIIVSDMKKYTDWLIEKKKDGVIGF